MKKVTLEIEFDDTDCYKGFGENTCEVIKRSFENELEYSLESDGVIKKGWVIKIIENKS